MPVVDECAAGAREGMRVGERAKNGCCRVSITHGVSSNDIALIVVTDPRAYHHIVPCGTPDKQLTEVLQDL
jgi:lipoate-protein ligase B